MANTDQDALEQFRAILSETSDVNGVGRVEFYGDDPTEPRMVMPLTRLRRVDRAAQAEALRGKLRTSSSQPMANSTPRACTPGLKGSPLLCTGSKRTTHRRGPCESGARS